MVISWSSFVMVAGEETGGKVIIFIMAVPDGDSRNDVRLSHGLDAEVRHAVGAVSSTCCRVWVNIPRWKGWYLLIINFFVSWSGKVGKLE